MIDGTDSANEKLGYGNGTLIKRSDLPADDCWWLRLKYKGNEFKRTTGTANKRLAKRKAVAIRDTIKAEVDECVDIEKMPISKLKKLYDKYLPQYQSPRRRHYTATKERPVSDKWYADSVSELGRFVAYLEAEHKAVKFYHQVTDYIVDMYVAKLIKSCKMAITFNGKILHLTHVFNVIKLTTKSNYFANIKKVPQVVIDEETTSNRPFTLNELGVLFEQSEVIVQNGKKDWLWIWLAVRAASLIGGRLGDIITLKWAEIDDEGFIQHADLKTGKADMLYIPELLPILARWKKIYPECEDSEWILPYQAKTYFGLRAAVGVNAEGKKPKKIKPDKSQASKQFGRFMTYSNWCRFEKRAGEKIGFSSIRSGFATNAVVAGIMSPDEVAKHLKHSSSATTRKHYIKPTEADQRDMLKREHAKRTGIMI